MAKTRVSKGTVVREVGLPVWYGWGSLGVFFLLFQPDPLEYFSLSFPLSFASGLLCILALLSLLPFILPGHFLLSRLEKGLVATLPVLILLAVILLVSLAKGGDGLGFPPVWLVNILLPSLVLIPILYNTYWRRRLYYTLAATAGLDLLLAVFASIYPAVGAGFTSGRPGIAVVLLLPLLAGWHGRGDNLLKLATLFLLPCLAFASLAAGPLAIVLALGLAVAWLSWRREAWLLGVFICLVVFGRGTEPTPERAGEERVVLASNLDPMEGDATPGPTLASYRLALDVLASHPLLGERQDSASVATLTPPWYAWLALKGGLPALLMWLVVLAELLARAGLRRGERLGNPGGLAGSLLALALLGLCYPLTPAGGGLLLGLLLPFSLVTGEGGEE
ncbi:MAG: hypothetical protein LBU79_05515 [Planctomycetota bacterium]|jgi:hypothetical protein|nr:hypothetical protein [Planctomycetota bacterium]